MTIAGDPCWKPTLGMVTGASLKPNAGNFLCMSVMRSEDVPLMPGGNSYSPAITHFVQLNPTTAWCRISTVVLNARPASLRW